MKREISKGKRKGDYEKFKESIRIRNNEFRECYDENRRNTSVLLDYIKRYKKNILISIKQISFKPIDKSEAWEIKEKRISWSIVISREISNLGIEILHINSILAKYKNIHVYLGGNLYSELHIRDGYSQTRRFFKSLTDYSKNIIVKEVKK